MDKINYILNKIINLLTIIFILIVPLYRSMYRKVYINNAMTFLFVLLFLFVIFFIINRKNIKFTKLDVLICSFSVIYFITSFFNHCDIKYGVYHFLICMYALIINQTIIKERKKRKIILSSIAISSFFTCILSLLSIFPISIMDKLNLISDYGDFYPTSIYRLYGFFLYPNALALFSLIGLIITLFQDYDNKLFYKIVIYVNTLTILLTMSKTIILLSIFAIGIISLYELKTKKKENVINLFINMLFPITYSLKIYNDITFSKNIYYSIPIFLIMVTIYIVTYELSKKYIKHKKLYNIVILIIYLIILFNPIPKELKTIKNIKNETGIILCDLYNIKGNSNYEITINYDSINNIDIMVNSIKETKKLYIENYIYDVFRYDNHIIKLKLNTKEEKEYYYIALSYPIYTEFSIKSIEVKDIKTSKTENINVNYYFLPTFYVNMFDALKYDVGSVNGRISAYKDTLLLAQNNLIVGNGYAYFEKNFENRNFNFNTIEEHSYLMKLLLETGIVGLTIFFILCTYSFIVIFRNIKNKNILLPGILFIIILLSALIDFTLSYNFILLIFLLSIYLIKEKDENNVSIK